MNYRKERRPVALLQLESYCGLCVLFRLSSLRMFPQELKVNMYLIKRNISIQLNFVFFIKDILEDDYIVKVGVGSIRDANHLRHDYSVDVKGAFDLRYMANICDLVPGKLSVMAKNYLGLTLDKEGSVPYSDWEATQLTQQQIDYAVNDAHAGIELFKYFGNKFVPKSFHMNDKDQCEKVLGKCYQYLDYDY